MNVEKKPIQFANIFGNLYVLGVFIYFAVFYYIFVFVYWQDRADGAFLTINLMFLDNVFNSVMFVLLHVFLVMFMWSFITVIITDPGQVPLYWVGDSSVIVCDVLGVLHGCAGAEEEEVLPGMPQIQARALPSLFSMQPLRPQHGPPLPLDQQLCGLLQPQVLHTPPDLHDDCRHTRVCGALPWDPQDGDGLGEARAV